MSSEVMNADESTVTVFVANTNITHADHSATEAVPFLKKLAGSVCAPGVSTTSKWLWRPKKNINSRDLKPEDYHEDCLIILCPNHARMLAARRLG